VTFALLLLAGYLALCSGLGFCICRMMDGAD